MAGIGLGRAENTCRRDVQDSFLAPRRVPHTRSLNSAWWPSRPPPRSPAVSTQRSTSNTADLERVRSGGPPQGSLLPASASQPRASDRRHHPRTLCARSPLTHSGRGRRTALLTGECYSPAQGLANVVHKKTQPGKAVKVHVWVCGAPTLEKAHSRCKADPMRSLNCEQKTQRAESTSGDQRGGSETLVNS